MNKNAALDLTLSRLIAIILMVAILGLVIYGGSTGAFIPLGERVAEAFDSAFRFIGLKKEPKIPVETEREAEILGKIEKVNLDVTGKTCSVKLDESGELYRLNFNENGRLEAFSYTLQKEFSLEKWYGQVVTGLYFRYISKWEWSPDDLYWMDCSETIVKGGKYDGSEPTEKNQEIIKSLEGKDFESGKTILLGESAPFLKLDWYDIDKEIKVSESRKQLKEDLDKACR